MRKVAALAVFSLLVGTTQAADTITLGLVRPGERLFIVKGIGRWKKLHGVTLGSSG